MQGREHERQRRSYTISLPDELLLQIFGYIADLDGDPPSVSRLNLEPSADFTRHEHQPLKTLSLVCQRWRHILLPDVFRCSRLTLLSRPRSLCLCSTLEEEIRKTGDPSRSQHARDLVHNIRSRKEASPTRAIVCNDLHKPMDLEYVEDDDSDLLSLPSEYLHWLPSIRGEVEQFIEFVKENGLQADIKSLVLEADQEMTPHPTAIEQINITREANLIWNTFLDTFTLGRLVIAAPPSTMAALTSTRDSPESWTFEMPLHYLCFSLDVWKTKGPAEIPPLSRTNHSGSSTSSTSPTQRVQARPHNLLPWTQLTYNEGTMLPGYAHYEWNFNRPSFILPTLLNLIRCDPNYERSSNITSLTYISNFPFSNHVKDIAEQLVHFNNLREVKIKFAEPNFLDDGSDRLGRGQMSDAWKEWEDSYKNLIEHFLKLAAPGTSLECMDTVYKRLFQDVDKIMKDNSVVMEGPMVGRSFLQTEIIGDGEKRRGQWVRRDI